ncbi:N-acetylneuraminate epimerase [Planctomycetes bacterium Poly30]|uniref:N-acetylneuraminate epimerase n=1 Tax=Saltatorellus ferox TaxID=2528018 RepID=A0A518EPY7_9BACT|nr:N-acetylneuraminate epimerase [Planctomycetes bacterium Poly30]
MSILHRALAKPVLSGLAFVAISAVSAPAASQITPSRSVSIPPAVNRPPTSATYVLSDLTPLFTEGSLGPVERNQSVGGLGANDGTPLVIGGQSFSKGLGTRAPSVIAYDLGGTGVYFSAWVGLDDAAPAGGSARFQVLGDGALLYDSGLRLDTNPALFTGRIDVRGVRELLLVTLDADDGFTSDHADWAQPVLVSKGRQPVRDGRAIRRVRGQWEPVLSWPVQPIHATLLPDGSILSHAGVAASGPGDPSPGASHDSTRVDVSDPATFSHFTVDHPTEELYGSGQARLADGTLLGLGGFAGRNGGAASGQPFGRDQASLFLEGSGAWIPAATMESARWGTTALTLGDGSVLALGGSDAAAPGALRPEVFLGGAWRTLLGVDLSGYLSVGNAPLDLTYPRAHVAPDGRVFWSGWDEKMGMIDARTGTGAWSFQSTREGIRRAWGTSTQVRPDYVVLSGGVDQIASNGSAVRSALRCSLGGANPTVQAVDPMLFRRADHNATILADGTMLVTGGNAGHADGVSASPWRVGEIFDPVTGKWSLTSRARRARGFRSAALLLPDGRVWTGGGQDPLSAQVYTPPYLFRSDTSGSLAPRPLIQSAPDVAAYSQTFAVGMASGAAISRVTLVRLGSSTHGTNSDQRFLELGFSQAGATLSVTAPARGHEAPPGHYMLFAFDGVGVPSVARIVRFGPPRPTAWQLLTSTNGSAPLARHETAAVTVGGKFYLIGGRGFRPTQEYDPVNRTWTSVGVPPFEMHHFQPVVVDGLVYVVGAFTGGYPNEQNVVSVYTWDPQTNVWQVVSSVPAARARGSAGTAIHDGKIYLVGGNNQGHNGGARPWFDCFDPATNTWTVLPDAPRARDHFLASVVGNRLVLAGGRTTDLPNPFDKTIPEVDVYDFTTGLWKTLAENLPTERAGTMAVPIGRHVVVMGGESNAMTPAHGEVEALDVFAERWTTLPSLVTPRHSGGVGVLDGRVFLAAGSGNQGGTPELGTAELLAASDVLAAEPLNLIVNGGFQRGLDGWAVAGGGELVADAGIAAPSLRLVAGSVQRTAPGQPGQAYASRMLYRLTAGGSAALRIEYLNSGGSVIGQAQSALSVSAAWRTAEVLFSAPAGTAALRVVAAVSGSAELTVDDLTLALR